MRASPVTFGCHLPVFGPIATRGNVLAFARKMEALGYESLWASDHVVLPYSIKSQYPYNATGEFPLPPSAAFLEPLATLAPCGGRHRARPPGHHHPGAAPSPSRARRQDHRHAGPPRGGTRDPRRRRGLDARGDRDPRRRLRSPRRLVRRGHPHHARVLVAGSRPLPGRVLLLPGHRRDARAPRKSIPIWVGGHTPRALRRVAELGDGWHAAFTPPDAFARDIERLRAECARRTELATTSPSRCAPACPSVTRPADPTGGRSRARPSRSSPNPALPRAGRVLVLLEARYRDLYDTASIFQRFAREIRPQVDATSGRS